ncbi:MAG: imidazolonepropionase [Gammaproteobacteria bacterium]|nr:imidazolonepropionase [Gammaproteobacteria bacterium]
MADADEAYGVVRDGLVAVAAGRITWVGAARAAPREATAGASHTLDGRGGWLTPGLIDCHTHLVFAGTRADEFEMRLRGMSYEEIARAGGGIRSTVASTRAATEEQLCDASSWRLETLAAHGVTTVEIKSGYGLDVDTELRMLRVAGALGERLDVRVSRTLLAAHALPPEYRDRRDAYLDLACGTMIPRAAAERLAHAVDAFCEGIAFTAAECARVFDAAAAHGLPVRLHADQLSSFGGAELAARYRARSADHLEYATETGCRELAAAGTTAVLLPGAYYTLGESRRPPVDALRRHGVPIAVATDLNPGSSPVTSPLLAMNMACVLFGLTPEEALAGMTRHAAPVLGLQGEVGVVSPGACADLVLWDVDQPSELSYWIGANPCRAVVRGGEVHDPRK